MKLKELPGSILEAFRLRSTSVANLIKNQEQVIPAIVSLTSIPSRLSTLDLTIRSMMRQKYAPEKVVLWLHDDLKNSLPKKLAKLQGPFFQIEYVPYTFSHRKLIHSLKKFPEKTIITCDDDVMYQDDTIKKLWDFHLKYPDNIIGNRCRKMTYENNRVNSYSQWPFIHDVKEQSIHNMPVGAFCVLYPSNSLHEDVHNVTLFNELAPKADDLWFKAMALKNGVLSLQNENYPDIPIPIARTQKVALKKENKGKDFNRVQWQRICDYYNWNPTAIENLI